MAKGLTFPKRLTPFTGPIGVLVATWGVYLGVVFSHILKRTPAGWVVGHEHVWSDWALHIGMTRLFATKSPADWFAYHPVYAGGQFTYPFVTNLLSGLLVKAGVSIEAALIAPSVVYWLLLLIGWYVLLYVVTQSRWLPVAVVSFAFLACGLGWTNYLGDLATNFSWDSVVYPPADYSRVDAWSWYNGSIITAMIVPQRAFLLGMTVGVWALAGLYWGLTGDGRSSSRRVMAIAGAAAGLLPIIHAHSFIAVGIISAVTCLFWANHFRRWLWFVMPYVAIGTITWGAFIFGGVEARDFMKLFAWWGASGLFEWLWRWIWLWGPLLPLLGVAVIYGWRSWNTAMRSFIAASITIFAVAQVVLFQPIVWDNSKLFAWSLFGISLPICWLLARWWKGPLGKLCVAALLLVTLFTGVIEAVQLIQINRHRYTLIDAEGLALGEAVQKTAPRAVFATAPIHNHPVMVWGARSVVMGYPGWVYTYGFDVTTRGRQLQEIFSGTPEGQRLLDQFGVDYIVFGPEEAREYGLEAEANFSGRYPLLYQSANYRVYDLTRRSGH